MVENPSSGQGPLRAIASLKNSKTKGSCGVAPISKRAVAVLCRWTARFGSRDSQFRVDHSHLWSFTLYWLIHKELGAGCQ